MTRRSLFLLSGTLLWLGCNRGSQSPEAIRQAVIDHLSSRSDLDLSSMQVDVTSVSFRENEAEATVSFRPKGGGAGSGMQMRYTLERQGNRWAVKKKADAGGSPHGGAMGRGSQLPPGHPPMTAAPAQPKTDKGETGK